QQRNYSREWEERQARQAPAQTAFDRPIPFGINWLTGYGKEKRPSPSQSAASAQETKVGTSLPAGLLFIEIGEKRVKLVSPREIVRLRLSGALGLRSAKPQAATWLLGAPARPPRRGSGRSWRTWGT